MTEPTGRLSFGDVAARIATGRIAGAFATTTALRALPAKARQDGMIALVTAGLELYAFDADGTSPSGLVPSAGSGRWMPIGAGGGGASDATSPLHLVRAASTGALAAATYASGTLTADANGALNPVDGVTLAVGDRFFYKDHGTATRRGIYVITALGGAGSKWSMERAADFDESADLSSGALIVISEGTANADQIYMLSVNEAIVLDTTNLTFTKLPSQAEVDAVEAILGSITKLQLAGGTFVNGTATINAGITVTADTDAFVIMSAVVTGSANVGCLAHLKASNVAGGPGVGAVTLKILGDDGAVDGDAAGAFRVLLVN